MIFFVKTIIEDGSKTYEPTIAGVITLVVIIIASLVLVSAFNRKSKEVQVKQLVFSSVAIAMAVVTGLYAVMKLPQGGSITFFRMFCISFIGYLYGTRAGITAGVAYGFIDMILDPYIVHPVQLLLDYPLAFGALGLSGIFSNSKYGVVKGYIVGILGRYICHILSGVIFFAEFAGDKNPLLHSIIYNAITIFPEVILTVVILLIPTVQNGITQVKRMQE